MDMFKGTRFGYALVPFSSNNIEAAAQTRIPGFIDSRTGQPGIIIYPLFLKYPVLPKAGSGIAGEPSMAGVMVHEWAHITLDIRDNGYGCLPAIERLGPLATGHPENYRCFVRDYALGDSNFEQLKKLVGFSGRKTSPAPSFSSMYWPRRFADVLSSARRRDSPVFRQHTIFPAVK